MKQVGGSLRVSVLQMSMSRISMSLPGQRRRQALAVCLAGLAVQRVFAPVPDHGSPPLRLGPPCAADDADAPMLRFLFVQAMQPYLRHMHVWAFTTHVSLDVADSG